MFHHYDTSNKFWFVNPKEPFSAEQTGQSQRQSKEHFRLHNNKHKMKKINEIRERRFRRRSSRPKIEIRRIESQHGVRLHRIRFVDQHQLPHRQDCFDFVKTFLLHQVNAHHKSSKEHFIPHM